MNKTNTPEFWDVLWSNPKRRIGKWLIVRTLSLVRELNVGSVLELGCGNGTLLARLRDEGHEVFGVDISGVAINKMKLQYGIDGLAMKAEDINQIDRRFDLIIMNHLLEHMDDDLEMLAKMRLRLNPGGKVLITVPNDTFGPDQNEEHVRKYTEESLKETIEKVFSNCKFNRLGINLIAIAEVL